MPGIHYLVYTLPTHPGYTHHPPTLHAGSAVSAGGTARAGMRPWAQGWE